MRKKIISAIAVCTLLVLVRCSNDTQPENTSASPTTTSVTPKDTAADKGIGQFQHVQLTHPLDESMVTKGEEIYKSKCFACHKLTSEKLVGPGWKGVTDRRTPEWILNFATNTNVMLDSDLVAQQLMVVCIARMPNQNLTKEDARNVLEFMRKNDGKN